MNAQDIINSLNSVSEKLFKSIESEVFTYLDKLVGITPDIFKEEPLKKILSQDSFNSIILIANSFVLFYIVFFVIQKLISMYNGEKSQSVYGFVIKLIIVGALVNSSFLICKEIINLTSLLSNCIDGLIQDVCGKSATFENLKESILKIEDLTKSDVLSLNGVIKGVISFGSISILINFGIRYVTIIFLIITSPFAFVTLSSESTVGIFKTWMKSFFFFFLTQIVVKIVIFIPLLYKKTNSMMYKIILVGSIYIIYKINNFTKQIFVKISSDMPRRNIFNN